MTDRMSGKVTRWDTDRGSGWIKRLDTGTDVYVGIRELKLSGFDRLTHGELIAFELRRGANGKSYAINLEEANTKTIFAAEGYE